jgi:AraC-like DNA-binding protein
MIARPPGLMPPPVPSAREDVDVLSDVLRGVRLTGALFFLTDATSPWSVDVPHGMTLAPIVQPNAQNLISYHIVTRGVCWCEGPGVTGLRLDAGDIVVISHGDRYKLSSPADQPGEWTLDEMMSFFRMMAARELPFIVKEGGGGPDELQVLCGFLGCDVTPYNPVLGTLPPILRVPKPPAHDDRLTRLIDFAMAEASERRAGSDCVLLRIAELMFVEVVRRHLATLAPEQTGWLAGLRHPIVGRSLALLHRAPERSWTLESLAREAGTSRSALADRFAHFVGTPPIQYLARWRMQIAARLLGEGDAKVAAVAAQVGYESEAAFNRAFTRMVGMPPAAWRKRQAARPSA